MDVEFSRSAVSDLLAIDGRTLELFGFDQSLRTEAEFRKTFDALAANPGIGHERNDLSPPGRPFRYCVVLRRFVIVYEALTGKIRIARVLDGVRDLPAALADDSGVD